LFSKVLSSSSAVDSVTIEILWGISFSM
jgi:hypothetical protein